MIIYFYSFKLAGISSDTTRINSLVRSDAFDHCSFKECVCISAQLSTWEKLKKMLLAMPVSLEWDLEW